MAELFRAIRTRFAALQTMKLTKLGMFFRRRKNNKILWSIISLFAIDVMNVLGRFKFAFQNTLHYYAMFKNFLSININYHVTLIANIATAFPSMMIFTFKFRNLLITRLRTIFSSFMNYLERSSFKLLTAKLADSIDSFPLAYTATFSRTVYSRFRGFIEKFFFTLFTNIIFEHPYNHNIVLEK